MNSNPRSSLSRRASNWRASVGLLSISALAFGATLAPSRLQAATYYWDPQQAVALGGTGTWDAVTANWSTTAAATAATVAYTNNAADAAHFSTAAGTVTIAAGTTINVNALFFDLTAGANVGYTIAGGAGSILNFSGTAPAITSNSGTLETISAAVTGTAGVTVTNGIGTGSGYPLRFTGDLSGLSGTINVGNGNVTTGGGYVAVGAGSVNFTSGAGQTWNIAANGLLISNNVGTGAVYSLGAVTGSGVLRSGTTGGATRAGTDTFQIGALNTDSVFTGTIIANGASASAITKVGTGTLTLSGANTYTGATAVNAGTLSLDNNNTTTARITATTGITVNTGGILQLAQSGATASVDRIGNAVPLTLAAGAGAGTGGIFRTGGFNEGPVGGVAGGAAAAGALTLGNNSTVDFSTGLTVAGSNLLFARLTYTPGDVVSIRNFTGTVAADLGAATNDRLLFVADPALTTAQLAAISFYGDTGVLLGNGATEIAYNGYFELVPGAVPEPGTWVTLGLGAGALGLVARRRRAQA